MISVSIVRPDAALAAPWDDLKPFAHNVFMNPTALKAASDTMLAAIYVLLAWEISEEPARLVGFWAVQAKQLLVFPFLEAVPFNYAALSTPVLHPDHADKAMPALLAAVAGDRRLAKTVVLRDLDAEGHEFAALGTALARHHHRPFRLDQRPVATREAGIKRSGSTRKKLRQDWNRLSALGELEMLNVRAPDAVTDALEAFLQLEARSWKGTNGTALLSERRDAAFARRLVADLAERTEASVALLTLDNKPIAAQVLLYCGRTAYTWKIAFDEELAKFSPGALLVDRISTELIDNGEVDSIDSCARGDSFMSGLWSGRKPMVDLVIATRPGPSLGFAAVSGYLRLREYAKHLRDMVKSRRQGGSRPLPPGSAEPAARPPAPDAAPQAVPAASSLSTKAHRAA